MWAFPLFFGLADRTTAPNLSLAAQEGFPPALARALLAEAAEFPPQGDLGELRHRQLIGRPGERHHGVSDLLQQLGRKVKSGSCPWPAAGGLGDGPGVPGTPKLPRG